MKQWLKKALILLCSVALVVLGAFGFVACDKEDDSDHVHSYTETVVDATCKAEGLKTLVCECGDVKTETLPKKAHTEEVLPAVPATCTSTGLTEGKRCSVCEEVLVAQEITEKAAHTEELVPAVPATCTSTGLTEGKICKDCKTTLVAQEITQKVAHTEEIIPAVASTCTSTGLTEGKKCSVCKEVLVAQEITQKVAHTEEIIPAVASTCTATGLTEGKKCSVCKEVLVAQEITQKVAHTEEIIPAVPATCTSTGLTEGKKCSVCKEVLVAQEEVPMAEHAYEEKRVEPGCLTEGYTKQVCGDCGYVKPESTTILSATGHNYTEEVTPATCGSQGYTTYTCSCGNSYKGNYTDPTGEHKYALEPEVVAPTCEDQGYTVYKCVCGETKKGNYVAATGHDYTAGERIEKPATCTETGVKYVICACGDEEKEDIAVIAHDYEESVVAPTCEAAGYLLYTCACGDSYKEVNAPALGHSEVKDEEKSVAPTCEAEGIDYYYCSNEGCEYTREETVAATGHNFKAGEVVAATCENEGYTVYNCACGAKENRDPVNALGHDYQQDGEPVAATCENAGYTYYKCTHENCEEGYSVETKALGHTEGGNWTAVVDEKGEIILTLKDGYTCIYEKQFTNTCGTCGATLTKTEEEEKHDYVSSIEEKATCQADGVQRFTCKCGETYTKAYTDSEAHNWEGNETAKQCTICGMKKTTVTVDSEETTLSQDALAQEGEVEVQFSGATVKLDEKTKDQLAGSETSLYAGTLSEEDRAAEFEKNADLADKVGDNPIYNFTVNDGQISQFDGMMTITVPYDLGDEDPESLYIWYIDNEGKVQSIKATYEVIDGQGYATFQTNHFSKYTVVRLTPTERCKIYGHNLKYRTVKATCTTDGYELEYCIRCGYNKTLSVDSATGHSYETHTTPATCISQGFDTNVCTNEGCSVQYKDNYTNALGHNYNGTVVAPTCIEAGYTSFVCDRCENSYRGEYVEATGHNYTVTVIAPTCTLQGKTEYLCANCSDMYYSDYVTATGHEYEDGETHEPTCSERGYTEIHCKHCDHGYHGKWKPAKGHDYKNKHEHAPTCQETGYTEYSCDCGVSYRADLKPKAGHDFDQTGTKHEPTCNEKGFTRHKCKHCDKYYDDDFKDKKKHTYEAGETVAPTCNKKGYTVYTCTDPNCNDFYYSDYKDEIGHSYNAEYVCVNCGSLHPIISYGDKGFYGTLSESVMNAESYYVTIEDFLYEYTYESADGNETTKATVEIFNLSFAFDEDGYIVGNGEFAVPVYSLREYLEDSYRPNYEDDYIAHCQTVFMDGMLYAFVSTDYEDDSEDYSAYTIVSQDWIFENIGLNKVLRKVFNEVMAQQTRDIVSAALGITNADANDAIGGLVEYLFAKTETEDGFVFTFDLQRVYDIVDSASKQTVAEWFNGIFGDGALEAVFTNVNSLLDKTVGEIATEVEANLAVAGYTMDDLYSTVDNIVDVMGNEEFSLEEIVNEYSDLVVIELITQGGGAEAEQQVRDMLEMAEQMCHETDIVSLIIDIVSSGMGGNGGTDENISSMYPSSGDSGWTSDYDSEPDSSYDVTTGYNLSSDSAYDSSSDSSASGDADDGVDDRVAYILDMIQMAMDYCGASEISFKTDKKGNMLSFTLNLDVEVDMSEDGTTEIGIVKGLARIELNKTYEMDTEELLQRMEALWSVSQFKEGTVIDGGDEKDDYVVSKYGTETWLALPLDIENARPYEELGTETIDGVEYIKIRAYSYRRAYWYSDFLGISQEESCGDWTQYSPNMYSCERTYYLVWLTKEGDILRSEVDYEYTKNNNYQENSGLGIWYNALTGEYKYTSAHSYVIVDEYHPTQCGIEGYILYECETCGDRYKSLYANGHEYNSSCELLDGANNCEEGCIYSEVCSKCGDVRDSKMGNGHNTRWQRVSLNTPCANAMANMVKEGFYVEYSACACGYESYVWLEFYGAGCNMELISEEYGEGKNEYGIPNIQKVYRCRECGYTVVVETVNNFTDCYRLGTFKITADDEVIVEKSYRRSSHNTDSKTVENADGSREITETCYDCGNVVSICKYDAQGREYYFVNENGFGYRVEYQGCDYVRTYFNANGDVYSGEGTNHIGENRYEYYLGGNHATSCKDGVYAKVYCSFCGEYMYNTGFDENQHYYNEYEQVFNTACGEVVVTYGICACEEMKMPGDVKGACDFVWNQETLTATCSDCGWMFKVENYLETQDGCYTTVTATYLFNYYDGEAEWSFDIYIVNENHEMTKLSETDANGNTVTGVCCANCDYFEYKDTYDVYGRHIKYVDYRGNGWYYEFVDGCMANRYYTYSDGAVEDYYYREMHVESVRYEFVQDQNCENGVKRIDYCAACGAQFGEDIYYHHETNWSVEYLITGCGQIRIEKNACACGYYSEVYVEPKAGCYFETDGYPKTDAEGNEIGRGYVYTCVNCGYKYVEEDYNEKVGCTNYFYRVYRFGIDGDTWEKEISSVRKDTNHNETWEEGATDDGCYLYERYCLDCGEQFEHRKTKDDEFGRRVYYYDYLTMSGWMRVYADDCSYNEFALNANEEVGTEVIGSGYGHTAIQYRAELMDGASNCEEGIYWIRYCEACGMEEERWNMNYHERFGHKVSIPTDCGIVYVIYNECACGQVKDTGVAVKGDCLIQHRNTQRFDDEENKFVHHIETYVCAVTDCGFTYTCEAYYYYPQSESCQAEWVYIWNAYVDGNEVFTYTATHNEYRHITEYTTETNDNGELINVNNCKYCEYVEKYDRFGRMLYRWQPENDYGEVYDYYDGCKYNHYSFDGNGNTWDEYSGEGHVWNTRRIEEACTQYGTAIEYCACCNLRQEYNYVEPRHDYFWNEELQTYVCNRCGLENQTGVDGYFLVEDLSNTYGAYTVGFFNRNGLGWNMEEGYNFYIVLNYGETNQAVTQGVEFDLFEYGYEYAGAGSGIVTLDTETLRAAVIAAFGENMEGFESVSIVFQAFDRDRLDYYDHVLTFDQNYI